MGKIISIRSRSFSGHAPANYVHLYFKSNKLTLTVLEKSLPGVVRGLVSPEEAWELLDQINARNGEPEAKWQVRADVNQAALDSGDPFKYVKVLKGLAHLGSEGVLRLRDQEHLNRSLRLLTAELASVLKKSQEHVRRLLTQAIGVS